MTWSSPERRGVRPFALDVPEEALADLRARLERTRWPSDVGSPGWDEGVPLGWLRELCEYWREGFDWPARQRALNALPHARTRVDGFDLHLLWAAGRGPDPLPLVLTHGWPSSFYEYSKLLPLLADPGAHGGDPADAFDVVVPALPGFPCSSAAAEPGSFARVAGLWRKLMTEALGYPSFVAFGGDLGAAVTAALGSEHADVVTAVQVMAVLSTAGEGDPGLAPEEREFLAARREWAAAEGGYSHLQQTRPRTLAVGLSDSPAGLLAWIAEKFKRWSDRGEGEAGTPFSRDDLLVTPTLYWAENSIGPSFRPYVESVDVTSPALLGEVRVPTGVALFPADQPLPPRRFAERHYAVTRWTELPRGGHFAALEAPELVAEEIRACFRPYRQR